MLHSWNGNLFCQENLFTVNEKVVLLADRDFYLSGEKVLFVARVFVEYETHSSDLSKILYVELFKDNKAIVQSKFRIENGIVEGNIKLPEEMLSGNYYLRAYTMMMRNGEPENFFNTLIRVVNPERKLEDSFAEVQKAIIIKHKGGKLVNGIESNTSIIFNKNILNTIKSALIVNNENDTLSNVLIAKNGLGSFSFVPKSNHEYWIKLHLKKGDSVMKKLQKAQMSGMSMSFDVSNSTARLSVQGLVSSEKLKLSIFNNYFMELSSKEVIMGDRIQSINFNNLNFSDGLNYLVAKKMDGTVYYVEAFYVSPKSVYEINASLNKVFFGKRVKVNMEVENPESNNWLSFSSVKKGLLINETENLPLEFVFNPLLLINNSEIINTVNKNVINQIDLCLTLNNSVFNTPEFKNKFVEKPVKKWIPEIRDLSIGGMVRNKSNKEPLSDQRIYCTVLGNQPQIHSYLSDENGNFVFSLNQLEGTKDVALTMDSIKNVDAEIIVFSDFSNRFPAFKDFPLQIDSTSKFLLQEMLRNQQVDYKFNELILNKIEYIDTVPFPFQDVQASIMLADYISLPNMQEVFNEIVTYANARKRGKRFVLNVLNESTETIYDKPLVLIDNLPIFNIDEVMKINPAKVEKIEVITMPYSFGEQTFKGIIKIKTKTDDFGGVRFSNETVFLIYKTSSLSSKQLFPNFNEQDVSANQPYFSNTIYWTNSSKNDEVSFFTSDEKGDFEVLVKRINSKGEVSRKILNLKVK